MKRVIFSAKWMLLAFGAACLFLTSASAEGVWPKKNITLMVPYAPGGGTDVIARLVGAKLSEVWGKSIIVENKSGANGVIGSLDVAKSGPDGYKIMLVVGSHIINPILMKSMPFDADEDFTPITRLAESPLVLVVPEGGEFSNLEDFLRKAEVDDLTVGYSEGQTQLTGELLRQATGAKITTVAYRGGAPLMVDIIGGHVQSGVTSILTALPHVRSGKLRVIGVADSERSDIFPEAKTFSEAGYPQVQSLSWYGIYGPKGMPDAVVDSIIDGLKQATQDPEILKQLNDQGAQIVLDGPSNFREFLIGEKKKWNEVAKKSGIEKK